MARIEGLFRVMSNLTEVPAKRWTMLKFASATVLSAEMGSRRTTLRTAHRADFDRVARRPGYLYVRSRAISSRCNDNYDQFPAAEIKKAYKSFIGKPVFVNHHNSNHRRLRGVVIDAALHEDMNPDGSEDTWVEVLMEVDAVRFPKLAEAILSGYIDRTSMGTDVGYSICSFCGNKASNPAEYCQHLHRLKGKRIRRVTTNGQREDILIREICHQLSFFENSLLVEDPADPTALVVGVESGGDVVPHLANLNRPYSRPNDPPFSLGVEPDLIQKAASLHVASARPTSSRNFLKKQLRRKKEESGSEHWGTIWNPATDTSHGPLRNVVGTWERTDRDSQGNKMIAVLEKLECGHVGQFLGWKEGGPPYSEVMKPAKKRRCGYCGYEAQHGTSDFGPDWGKVKAVLGINEVKAPPPINTLRENCPVCGERVSYDGQTCQVCGFVMPPEPYMDPDLTKARDADLRQEMANDLTCDNCGASFSSGNGVSLEEAEPFIPPKQEDVEIVAGEESWSADQVHKAPSLLKKPEELTPTYSEGDSCPVCKRGTLRAKEDNTPVQVSQPKVQAEAPAFVPPADQQKSSEVDEGRKL